MNLQLRLIVIISVSILLGCGENDDECLVEDFLAQGNVCTIESANQSQIGTLSDFDCEIVPGCMSASCPIGFFPNGIPFNSIGINFEITAANEDISEVMIAGNFPSNGNSFTGNCNLFVEPTCTDNQISSLGMCIDIPEECFFEDEFEPECPAPDIAASCQLDGIEFGPRGFGCGFTNGEIIESGTLSTGNCEVQDCFNLSCTIGMNISGVFTQVPIELEITDPNPDPEIGVFEFDAVFDGEDGFKGSCGIIVI